MQFELREGIWESFGPDKASRFPLSISLQKKNSQGLHMPHRSLDLSLDFWALRDIAIGVVVGDGHEDS